MEQILLVHLSDLHFGPEPLGSDVPAIQPLSRHDPLLCRAASTAIRLMLARCGANQASTWILVTGDLTASGQAGEFTVAHTWLRSSWRPYRGDDYRMGLDWAGDRCLAVPGNHDHWGAEGNGIPNRYNPKIYGSHFEPTPWRTVLHSPGGRLRLELFGVDSCSGPAGPVENALAGGAISNEQFARLEGCLAENCEQAPGEACFRAIACHHSLARNRFMSWTRALSESSQAELLRLADKYQVHALLTGHAHSPRLHPYPVSGTNRKVWEVRSPSTLQAGAPSGAQGFWIHRLSLDRAAPLRWEGFRYLWDDICFCPGAPEILD
jgi:3',5'-cyclic AMP phosphodiesterase CpdA